MYIKSFYKYQNEFLDEKEYKKLLKPITNMDLRRISKFNLLSIYGSLNTLKDINFSKSCSIYLATNSGCIDETYKVLSQLKENNPIMPFDFLNINTNNTGFYISKALELNASSYTVSSTLSFERALELAFNDYKNGTQKNFLTGYCESSLGATPNQEENSFDNSSWIYFDDIKTNSISKIEDIKYFSNLDEINFYIKDKNYENVVLNSFLKECKNDINISKNSNIFLGDIFLIFENRLENSVYIAIDSKKRAYLIEFY